MVCNWKDGLESRLSFCMISRSLFIPSVIGACGVREDWLRRMMVLTHWARITPEPRINERFPCHDPSKVRACHEN